MLVQAGLPGILWGVMTVFMGGVFNILTDKGIGGTGIAGAAASSTAGNSVATPMAVAIADPSLHTFALAATPQVAASVIVTAILTPMLTLYISKRNKKKIAASLENEIHSEDRK